MAEGTGVILTTTEPTSDWDGLRGLLLLFDTSGTTAAGGRSGDVLFTIDTGDDDIDVDDDGICAGKVAIEDDEVSKGNAIDCDREVFDRFPGKEETGPLVMVSIVDEEVAIV